MADGSSGLVAFITSGITPLQLERLFVQPYAVVAILRSLPPLARHILLRFSCTGGTVSTATVSTWGGSDGQGKLAAALEELEALRLLIQAACKGQAVYTIHASFQAQLRHAMCSGLLAGHAATLPPRASVPDAGILAAYARQQWEALLLYLVGGEGTTPVAPPELQAASIDIRGLLVAAGLMAKDERTQRQSITQRGFQFLLADLYSQLWGVVRQYLSGLEAQASDGAGGGDLAVAINFLLCLGLQEGCNVMCHGQLGDAEKAIAAHMCQLGLLLPVAGGGELWLHPTRLAAVLAGGGRGGEAVAAQEDGYVIVESNFRVYAYTTSAVQVAVLRVFVRCDVLLPNLFVGTITRDSATSALGLGITSEQMVAFLRQHAHPRAAARVPTVPSVVADQIRLWQQELTRLQMHSAMLYDKFESQELYIGAVEHARQLGALLFRCDKRMQLAVPAALHGAMRTHLQERKRALGL
ncbi:hypothetical protein D9Q98_001693 [Chlorella vulgaris]|uniref:RNA polymerase II transcription factor B subunit 2 n=1 Tax=Chlorella vulgaris TaxID=3077 RepID=A0A9D4TV22_CHLVU|nr:hypothetical protein D9Q98_001693 [Chlorella vulgaris]